MVEDVNKNMFFWKPGAAQPRSAAPADAYIDRRVEQRVHNLGVRAAAC